MNQPAPKYQLVRLANGAHTVYASSYGEKMHPGLGPQAEAELLYVRQLKIRERMSEGHGKRRSAAVLSRSGSDAGVRAAVGDSRGPVQREFIVWDVGLGAAANAVAVLRATRDIPHPLRLVSFDDASGALEFALTKAERLGYFQGYETTAETLLEQGTVTFQNGQSRVTWEFHFGDFPTLLTKALERRSPGRRGGWSSRFSVPAGDKLKLELQLGGAPHAIMFDAFSPAKNPAMWTLPLFTNLFRLLDPARPGNLTTYSRSSMLRVTLLLAGFFVGRGVPTGLKEETTVAANTLTLIDEPLDRRWLERARRSDSAEPLRETVYTRSPLTLETWERLRLHRQFCS